MARTLIAQVDDDAQALILVRRAMAHQLPDMELVEVRKASHLQELMATRRPDAILLDFNLPDRDGLGVLRDLRRDNYDGAVIFITGVGSEKVAVEAMKRGATDYIVKTAGYEVHIPRAILKVLERVRIEREIAEADASRRSNEMRAASDRARSSLAAQMASQLREPLGRALEDLDSLENQIVLAFENPAALAAARVNVGSVVSDLRNELERLSQALEQLRTVPDPS